MYTNVYLYIISSCHEREVNMFLRIVGYLNCINEYFEQCIRYWLANIGSYKPFVILLCFNRFTTITSVLGNCDLSYQNSKYQLWITFNWNAIQIFK